MLGKMVIHKEIIKLDSHLTSDTKINSECMKYFKLLEENIPWGFSTDSTSSKEHLKTSGRVQACYDEGNDANGIRSPGSREAKCPAV